MWEQLAREICDKTLLVCRRSGDRIPYLTGRDGRFDDQTDRNISWWTNGFWAGQLWQVYAFTGDEDLRRTAVAIEEKLDRALLDDMGMDHDSGFKWLPTAGEDYLLTGSGDSRRRLLLAASNLAGRFNPAGEFIRAWNDREGKNAGWAIIDCLMNLPLLYRASDLTSDPRFAQVAARHAHTAVRHFLRPDGSCEHIVVFDPVSGKKLDTLAGQGMYAGSAWSRGQAWAIYGFTLSYLHTGDTAFLDAAKKAAAFFCGHIPASGLIPADFCQGPDCDFEDDSAAVIAVCGLLTLAEATDDGAYKTAAERLLSALVKHGRCDLTPDTDCLLTRCSVSYDAPVHDHPLIYADYFFTEAVLKLAGKGLVIW